MASWRSTILAASISISAGCVLFLLGSSFFRFSNDVASEVVTNERAVTTDPEASCGPVSLAVVSRWLRKPVTIAEFNKLTGANSLGVCSMLDLKHALTTKGFSVEAVQFDPNEPLSVTDPMVIYQRHGHFCVVIPVEPSRLIVIDPPAEPELVNLRSVAEGWDGEALVVHLNSND